MPNDLELAFLMVDAADVVTGAAWMPGGVAASAKSDGSPVTEADVAAELAMRAVQQREAPANGFLGEEIGWHQGSKGRRWIADGIDGTRFFAAGATTWGTLLALEVDGVITVAVCSSPLQQRRWWAIKGGGAFTGGTEPSTARRIRVNTAVALAPELLAFLPGFDAPRHPHRHLLQWPLPRHPPRSAQGQMSTLRVRNERASERPTKIGIEHKGPR